MNEIDQRDMYGSPAVEVVHLTSIPALVAVLNLVRMSSYTSDGEISRAYTGFRVADDVKHGYGDRLTGGWLVLTDVILNSERDRWTPFLAPMDARSAAEQVREWLAGRDPDGPHPGVDGTVKPGSFHAVASWGLDGRVAFRHCWSVYGK